MKKVWILMCETNEFGTNYTRLIRAFSDEKKANRVLDEFCHDATLAEYHFLIEMEVED